MFGWQVVQQEDRLSELDHLEADILPSNEALADNPPILIGVDLYASNVPAVDHSRKTAARLDPACPDLTLLETGLISFACVDRCNPYAGLSNAECVTVDHACPAGNLRRQGRGGGCKHDEEKAEDR
jgi:hypothetical protein